ncbi:MAG: HAD hydrolase-like protein [Gemmatimonadaceae bacterium]|nr:HAD hydrolase-like protein [Gemmatimonadaceae bacterium]
MKLVLFDIDGTMLKSEGVGRASMESALAHVFGSPGNPEYRYDGKTDKQIVREAMKNVGHADEIIDERMNVVMDHYVGGLEERIGSGKFKVRTLPGVPELLDALEQRDDVILGLLTGNIVEGARRKLAAAGVDFARFRINAFGSDHEHRPKLPAIAQQRAKESLGLDLPGDRIYVIGDTPADIACGRELGARAIAVATGHYSVDDLKAHDPFAVVQDLSQTDAVMEVIARA